MAVVTHLAPERWRIVVCGLVQGVGFRPFVYNEALRLGLSGFVRNDEAGVTIEAEGDSEQLAQLLLALRAQTPPLVRVDSLAYERLAPRHAMGFAAGRFHRSVAAALAHACTLARDAAGLSVVALSGGVFQNRRLLELLWAQLHAEGFQVYTNRQVPPNDGGLSLGQAAVAAARLAA